MGLLTRLKNPKVFVPLLLVILVAAAAVMAVRNLNSPAQGTITTQVSDTSSGQHKIQPAYKTYSDSVVTFNYPGIYTAAAGQKNTGYLDAIELRKTQQRTEFANIGVYPGTLANESGISYRNGHPELYKQVPSGDGSVVYSKNDFTEYTGFLQKGADIVTISFTSIGAHDFGADYKMVADSLTLKQ